nr:iron uptake porin [Gloeocapsopsis dulcis]
MDDFVEARNDLWRSLLAKVTKEGNLLGFVFGQPPRVISNQFGVIDRSTSLHFETFYRFQINDHLSITPGVIVITNPEHNSNNDTIFVGTIRTTFQF